MNGAVYRSKFCEAVHLCLNVENDGSVKRSERIIHFCSYELVKCRRVTGLISSLNLCARSLARWRETELPLKTAVVYESPFFRSGGLLKWTVSLSLHDRVVHQDVMESVSTAHKRLLTSACLHRGGGAQKKYTRLTQKTSLILSSADTTH